MSSRSFVPRRFGETSVDERITHDFPLVPRPEDDKIFARARLSRLVRLGRRDAIVFRVKDEETKSNRTKIIDTYVIRIHPPDGDSNNITNTSTIEFTKRFRASENDGRLFRFFPASAPPPRYDSDLIIKYPPAALLITMRVGGGIRACARTKSVYGS